MNTRSHSLMAWPVLAGLALFLALTGCSSDKTLGPLDAGRTSVNTSLATPLAQSSTPDSVHSVSAVIDGAVGGKISAGRFKLFVPAGAFQGVRTITLQPTNGSKNVQCQCLPEGLQFDVPATLEINLGGTNADGPDATVYWYSPSAANWVNIGGTYDGNGHKVSASLHHFSIYAGGRAGW